MLLWKIDKISISVNNFLKNMNKNGANVVFYNAKNYFQSILLTLFLIKTITFLDIFGKLYRKSPNFKKSNLFQSKNK